MDGLAHGVRPPPHLLHVALFGHKDGHGIVGNRILLFLRFDLVHVVDDLGLSGLSKLLGDFFQLLDDHIFQLPGTVQNIPQLRDFLFQLGNGLGLFEDVLLVDVAKLNFRHIVCLNLIDAKLDHQVGNHFAFLLRLPDTADSLVDVQQDPLQTLQ